MDSPSHYADTRKIAPGLKPDGSPDDNDRIEIGPSPLAFAEWEAAGLTAPNLDRMRRFRWEKLVAAINARGWGGLLLFDPLNIRYATDTTHMQLWNTHNPFRATFVGADGYMLMWEYKGISYLADYNPLVRETRGGASMFYFSTGDFGEQIAHDFAGQIVDLLNEHGAGNMKCGIDKIMLHGADALRGLGVEIMDGEECTEKTRAVKGLDEINAMRCAMHSCEASVAAMEAAVEPGMTENDVWAVLHAENIKRGGEWIETRILCSGPRTNPWFQECGPRVISEGELLAFDTDLIGCYGQCCDISRTWLVGDGDATPEQKRLYTEAHRQIIDNMAPLAPGKSFKEISFGGRPIPQEFIPLRYGSKMHGVGLCDEWPSIRYEMDWRAGQYDYELEPGMMLCVEAYVGAVGGREGVKLEDQVLITEDGFENLTTYPWDARLLG